MTASRMIVVLIHPKKLRVRNLEVGIAASYKHVVSPIDEGVIPIKSGAANDALSILIDRRESLSPSIG
jgi:hypothetical protein